MCLVSRVHALGCDTNRSVWGADVQPVALTDQVGRYLGSAGKQRQPATTEHFVCRSPTSMFQPRGAAFGGSCVRRTDDDARHSRARSVRRRGSRRVDQTRLRGLVAAASFDRAVAVTGDNLCGIVARRPAASERSNDAATALSTALQRRSSTSSTRSGISSSNASSGGAPSVARYSSSMNSRTTRPDMVIGNGCAPDKAIKQSP